MKKFISVLAAALTAMVCMCFTAFAETEDVELNVTRAIESSGSWGQSITFSVNDFDFTRITEESQIIVEYELNGDMPTNIWPAEIIFQNYTVEPQIWAKIAPVDYSATSATFDYAGIIAEYVDHYGGSADFSDVNNMCVGDCGVPVKVTKFTVTNCTAKAAVTTTTAAETEAVTEAATEAPAETTAAPAETTAAEKTEDKSESGSLNMTLIIIIVVAVIVVAGVVVTIIVVKKNRSRFY